MFDAHPARSFFLLLIIVRFRACVHTGAVRLRRPVYFSGSVLVFIYSKCLTSSTRRRRQRYRVWHIRVFFIRRRGGWRDGKTMTTRLIMVINYFHSVFVPMFSPWTVAKHLSVFLSSSAVQSPLGRTDDDQDGEQRESEKGPKP